MIHEQSRIDCETSEISYNKEIKWRHELAVSLMVGSGGGARTTQYFNIHQFQLHSSM